MSMDFLNHFLVVIVATQFQDGGVVDGSGYFSVMNVINSFSPLVRSSLRKKWLSWQRHHHGD
ncbi:MAG: hypothetical protein IPJ51_19955 [Saprospiraceae bacterium]|nr:hypothetical protein [Saprospiraceae bacterium]